MLDSKESDFQNLINPPNRPAKAELTIAHKSQRTKTAVKDFFMVKLYITARPKETKIIIQILKISKWEKNL